MKYSLSGVILLSICFSGIAQSNNRSLFESESKAHSFYYIDLGEADAIVYKMGRYYDHLAGSANAIVSADTLMKAASGIYSGKQVKIEKTDGRFFLIIESKKTRRLPLEPVKSVLVANAKLNNAYYLGCYIKMNEALKEVYPLCNQSFRDGYLEWDKLQHKEMEYIAFRKIADKNIDEIRDSIGREQSKYVALMNYLVQSMQTIEYDILKDSLAKLNSDNYSGYYRTTVNEIARQRPEYFFKLSENCSRSQRDDMFYTVDIRDRKTLSQLKSVEGHAAIKKTFMRNMRFRKVMPFATAGLVTAELAGIVWLFIILL